MNKKIGLVLLIITAFLIAGIVFLILKSKTRSSLNQPTKSKVAPTPILLKTKEYLDPSGFKFAHSKDFTVVENKIIDNDTYSDLTLKSSSSAEIVSIKAVASNLKTIDDWFKNNKQSSPSSQITKIKLADLEARQFKIKNDLTTIALDQGVIFTITGPENNNYQTIIKTFGFYQPPTSNNAGESSVSEDSPGDIIFEGEEIVE